MSRPYCEKHRKYKVCRGGEFWKSCPVCNQEEEVCQPDPCHNRDLKKMIKLEETVAWQLVSSTRYPYSLEAPEDLHREISEQTLKSILKRHKTKNKEKSRFNEFLKDNN